MHLISVEENVMKNNNEIARVNKKNFDDHGVFIFNLMSAPGAGKTTFLESVIPELSKDIKIPSSLFLAVRQKMQELLKSILLKRLEESNKYNTKSQKRDKIKE